MTPEQFIGITHKIHTILGDNEREYKHASLVHEYVLQLRPTADYALRVAALSHDIDRLISPRVLRIGNEPYSRYKNRHAKRSASLMQTMLDLEGEIADTDIAHIFNLIKRHEVGGNEDQNLLRDADSIAFLSDGLAEYEKNYGIEETKLKVHFMYDRASDITKDRILKLLPNVVKYL